jgi:hypothetical protein
MTPRKADYSDIRDMLDTGDVVAFGGGGGIVGRVIRAATFSKHHHVAVVYRNEADRITLLESSMNYGGVRGVGFTYLSQRMEESDGIVDVLKLGNVAINRAAAQRKCEALLGRKYDYVFALLSGFGQWLRIPGRQRLDALFCSELVDAVHVAGGLVVGRDRTPTPAQIIKRPIYAACWRIKGEP